MLRAVIIDDELAAVNALRLLIEKHTDNVQVIAGTTECMLGMSVIEEQMPEIVFLDISMPEMSGFSLLKQLKYKDFNLVFTTAHERYAIQAIKHHASDYLVKPIDIDELKSAIDNIIKIRESMPLNRPHDSSIARRVEYSGRIGLPVKEGLVYLPVAEIIWISSDGSYSTFHTTNMKKYMVSKNLGEFEELLPEPEFFRAHKSHLINVRKVKKYIRTDGYFVEMEDGSIVEISRRRKDEFLHLMNALA